jgi:hypothetical protein
MENSEIKRNEIEKKNGFHCEVEFVVFNALCNIGIKHINLTYQLNSNPNTSAISFNLPTKQSL